MKVRAALLILILTPTAGADIWAAANRSSCSDWAKRPVQVREMTLDDIEQHYAAPVLTIRNAPGWTWGIALPGVTILEEGSDFRAWAHEQAHQAQMRQDGYARYLARYTYEWLRGRYAGCGTHDAYRSISYEIEARALEDVLEAQWRRRAEQQQETSRNGS